MTAETGAVIAVRMPQVNANDEEVTLLDWKVEDGGRAVEGEPICEVETSKSVGDLPSPASGVLRHAAQPGDVVGVDAVVAYVGPTAQVIDSYLSMLGKRGPKKSSEPQATVPAASLGAVELARRAGVDLSEVPASGDRLRRSDVEKYLSARGTQPRTVPLPAQARAVATLADEVLPGPLQSAVEEVEALSNHQWAISQHLKETQNRLVVAHAVMDVNMSRAMEWIQSQKQAGQMASPLPVLVKAAASAITACPPLQQFRLNRRVFRYRSMDIAFTARSHQGWLYTPVVRAADRLSLSELAARCGELAMAAFRGELGESDLAGGCLTVSLLNDQPVRFHLGLQNNYQTALLTSGAIRDELRMIDGRPTAVPTVTLALSYDHGLLDGWEAAGALDAARMAIENWTL